MTHQKRPGCALVTGASGDIGAQIALRLAQDGWNIAVGYATGIERAEEVAGRIRECGVSAMPIKIDVTSTTSVDDAFDALEDSLGQVTVLVNNAGIRSDGLVAGLSDDEWDAAISTNLSSVFRTSRRALGPMIRARFGRIINISSILAGRTIAGTGSYSAAKSGILGITRAMAIEVARRGVTVNAVCPGLVETSMTEEVETFTQSVQRAVPMARPAQARDIAECVAFLASDRRRLYYRAEHCGRWRAERSGVFAELGSRSPRVSPAVCRMSSRVPCREHKITNHRKHQIIHGGENHD